MKSRGFLLTFSMLLLLSLGCNIAHGQAIVKQGPAVPANFCINAGEMKLYNMINEYRRQNNLAPVPLSKSLSHVAALHVKDLFLHHPDQGACNFHSWSNKGSWTPFCYPKDENKKSSVWDKPRELTKYPSKAYEIVYWENNPLVTDTIFMVWQTEEYFNNFLLNAGKWQGKTWNAIGIAVYKNYACAWFGETNDPEGDPYVCGAKPPEIVKDTVIPVVKPVLPPPVKPKKQKPAKTIVNKVDSVQVKKADSLPVKAVPPEKIKPATPATPADSTIAVYYIIVKTGIPLEAANKLAETLKAGDYPDANVLSRDDKIRVSVFQSPDKAAATAKLREVKKTVYKDAWLLKR
ncbi:MAG: CAP domain-containing protein [bacterium]